MMFRFLIAALLLSSAALAQTPAPPDSAQVLDVSEVPPAPVGGLEAVVSRAAYPESALQDRVEGTVVVRFVVEPDGTASQATALRSPDERLATAAVAAVRASAFTPGRERGEAVRVQFALPITFRLPEAPADVPEPEQVRVEPQLIGGLAGLGQRVEYPKGAWRAGVEGVVTVQFVVNEEGAVEDAFVVRGVSLDLDRAAVEAVRGCQFTPGLIDGEPVRVRFAVPITFRLTDPQPVTLDGLGNPIDSRRSGL